MGISVAAGSRGQQSADYRDNFVIEMGIDCG
jgi:hypothetical protein